MTRAANLAAQASNINSSGVAEVAAGGTGLSSPGTSGNVLTSDGTNWVSQSISTTPTTAQVVAAYVGISAGGVGAYATTYGTTASVSVGSTIAGSNLRGLNSSGSVVSPGFSGTWRVIGCSDTNTSGYSSAASLVLRIA